MRMSSTNPLLQVVAIIGGLLLFTAALFIGAFVFLAMIGIVIIGGTVMSLRLWWLRRQLRQHGQGQTGQPHRKQRQGMIIEGEVVRPHKGRDEKP
ncbi:MAG: hypothetical protein WED00_00550 [Aquisalimonadaceae bacterium]